MAAVILTVLKIIGIVIASVIGLVLILAAIILFVPIRYRIKADKKTIDDDLCASARVTFLLHILSGGAVFKDEFSYYFKIFGIKVIPSRRSQEEESSSEESANEGMNNDQTGQGIESSGTESPDESPEHPSEEIADDFTIDWNENDDQDITEDTDDSDLFDKIDEIIEKIVSKYDSLSEKYEDIRKGIRFWDRMINDTRNRQAAELIKKLVIKVLKKAAPRRIKGFVHFGTDDPALTGKILMYLSMIYPILPRKLIIEPGFEDTDIYGYGDIKGYIRLITPGVAILRFMTNKDCRRLWRLYKKHTDR
ncbi:MAG: hypothetical protein K6F87_06375 [Lachnospiraceae bacterium]|nr:hypothetical protein [Lachnospiraceae bacterium]